MGEETTESSVITAQAVVSPTIHQPRVFVLDVHGQPLMPCKPRTARLLLRDNNARVVRRMPFTIRMTVPNDGYLHPIELRLDPGSKTTGLALVAQYPKRGDTVVFAAEIQHRGQQIHKTLQQRAAYRRRRRSANLRHRAPRFNNRRRAPGWLAPSIQHRVDSIVSLARKMQMSAPLSSVAVETVRFDTQLMQDAVIASAQYQQGTLAGYELREYLLEKWNRTCAYCDATGVPLQIEHVVPKAHGGSDRVSNLTLACGPCNNAKADRPLEDFLAHDPVRLAGIRAQLKASLRDPAAVNATRYAIGKALKALGLAITFWSGGRTKFNRRAQGYPKTHWIDAACVGDNGNNVRLDPESRIRTARSIGRGTRQVRRSDAYGFPRGRAKRVKDVRGFRTGDLVRLVQPQGKYAGIHVGTVAVRERGDFDVATPAGKITAPHSRFTLLQRNDGYRWLVA
jgi:5-methylcytosine-specific restriction endonuclease McrA